MAFPIVVARTETNGTSATDPVINFVQTTGDMVVIFLGINNTPQDLGGVTGGWDHFWDSPFSFGVFYKSPLVGTEGGSMQVSFLTNTKFAAIAYNIQRQRSSGLLLNSGNALGDSATPDPPSMTPESGAVPLGSLEYLWLAGFRQNGEEADDDTWCTSAPATPSPGFSNLVQKTSGTSGQAATNGSVAIAELQLEVETLNPGTFATAQSLPWHAITVAIFPDFTKKPYINPYPQLLAH